MHLCCQKLLNLRVCVHFQDATSDLHSISCPSGGCGGPSTGSSLQASRVKVGLLPVNWEPERRVTSFAMIEPAIVQFL